LKRVKATVTGSSSACFFMPRRLPELPDHENQTVVWEHAWKGDNRTSQEISAEQPRKGQG
jgi:hypothetical protein